MWSYKIILHIVLISYISETLIAPNTLSYTLSHLISGIMGPVQLQAPTILSRGDLGPVISMS